MIFGFPRWAAYLFAGVGALALLFVLYQCGRGDGIETERARAEAAERTRFDAANNRSTAERDTQQNAAATNASNMQGAITNATTAHPAESRQPVGPAVSGSLDQLRRRTAPKPRQ